MPKQATQATTGRPVRIPPCRVCGVSFDIRLHLTQHMGDEHNYTIGKVAGKITYKPPVPPQDIHEYPDRLLKTGLRSYLNLPTPYQLRTWTDQEKSLVATLPTGATTLEDYAGFHFYICLDATVLPRNPKADPGTWTRERLWVRFLAAVFHAGIPDVDDRYRNLSDGMVLALGQRLKKDRDNGVNRNVANLLQRGEDIWMCYSPLMYLNGEALGRAAALVRLLELEMSPELVPESVPHFPEEVAVLMLHQLFELYLGGLQRFCFGEILLPRNIAALKPTDFPTDPSTMTPFQLLQAPPLLVMQYRASSEEARKKLDQLFPFPPDVEDWATEFRRRSKMVTDRLALAWTKNAPWMSPDSSHLTPAAPVTSSPVHPQPARPRGMASAQEDLRRTLRKFSSPARRPMPPAQATAKRQFIAEKGECISEPFSSDDE